MLFQDRCFVAAFSYILILNRRKYSVQNYYAYVMTGNPIYKKLNLFQHINHEFVLGYRYIYKKKGLLGTSSVPVQMTEREVLLTQLMQINIHPHIFALKTVVLKSTSYTSCELKFRSKTTNQFLLLDLVFFIHGKECSILVPCPQCFFCFSLPFTDQGKISHKLQSFNHCI